MSERITVYCRKAFGAPDWLARFSQTPDYTIAAEGAGLDEAEMDSAIAGLTLELTDGVTNLGYAGAPRPIQVACYDTPAMLAELLGEVREHLGADQRRIGLLLAATICIVDFELGIHQAEGIGGVIAEQIAREIAFATEGIVNFYGNEWFVAPTSQTRG